MSDKEKIRKVCNLQEDSSGLCRFWCQSVKEREARLYYPPSSLPSELSLRREVAVEIRPEARVEGADPR